MTYRVFALCLALVSVAGCNTTRGIGQDIEIAGDFIEEIAAETKEKSTEDSLSDD